MCFENSYDGYFINIFIQYDLIVSLSLSYAGTSPSPIRSLDTEMCGVCVAYQVLPCVGFIWINPFPMWIHVDQERLRRDQFISLSNPYVLGANGFIQTGFEVYMMFLTKKVYMMFIATSLES